MRVAPGIRDRLRIIAGLTQEWYVGVTLERLVGAEEERLGIKVKK